MLIYKATKTLDEYIDPGICTTDKSEAHVLVVGGKSFDLNDFPVLTGVFKCGVGVDNVPFDEADAHGIKICLPSDDTKQAIFEETASYASYLCLHMLLRDVGKVEEWEKASRRALAKKRVLVLGVGQIGGRVAKKLAQFVQVLTYDPLYNHETELQGLLESSDVVSLHMPLTAKTQGFLDATKLSWLRDGTVLVNTARGPIVDEEALYREISAKRLRAAFDVFWQEPYSGRLAEFHPDWFYMTPHVASTSVEFLEGLSRDLRNFVEQLKESSHA